MSSVGNHSPGESFLSKIDIFKPTARNNSGEKTSSEAITLWGGVKISCLPESLNFVPDDNYKYPLTTIIIPHFLVQ